MLDGGNPNCTNLLISFRVGEVGIALIRAQYS